MCIGVITFPQKSVELANAKATLDCAIAKAEANCARETAEINVQIYSLGGFCFMFNSVFQRMFQRVCETKRAKITEAEEEYRLKILAIELKYASTSDECPSLRVLDVLTNVFKQDKEDCQLNRQCTYAKDRGFGICPRTLLCRLMFSGGHPAPATKRDPPHRRDGRAHDVPAASSKDETVPCPMCEGSGRIPRDCSSCV